MFVLRYQHAEADGIGHTYFVTKGDDVQADDGVAPSDALRFDTVEDVLSSAKAAALVEAGRVPQAIDLAPPAAPGTDPALAARVAKLEEAHAASVEAQAQLDAEAAKATQPA